MPLVVPHGDVPVVDIVAPNAQGLSHNQFNEYNVGRPGAVLNNSLDAGRSILAGQLNANSRFNGAAATTILNEVVGTGASRIHGPQEIFGHAADYILANPNGIHVNGSRLINSPHAAFLVGTPQLEGGRITGLNTFDARGQLDVGTAGLSSEGAVDLIAPKVHIDGEANLSGALTVITGRNSVDPSTGQVLGTHQGDGEVGIDTSLLGGMRVGRIRVVSTAEGAGVRMAGTDFFAETGGIEVSSAGGLRVGELAKATRLAASQGDISLNARDDLLINNTRAAARNVRGHAGGDIRISPGSRSSERSDRPENWNSRFLGTVVERKKVERTTHKTEHTQTVITAQENVEFNAGRNLAMKATDIRAENHTSFDAAGSLDILPAKDSTEVNTRTIHRKGLWGNDSTGQSTSERLVPTRIEAQTVSLRSSGDIGVRGSEVRSTADMAVLARELKVESEQLTEAEVYREHGGDHLGGLVSKRRENKQGSTTLQVGSNIEAGGVLTVTADQVRITGSRVHGQADATLQSKTGAVVLESSHNLKQVKHTTSDHTVFGAFGNKQAEHNQSMQAKASEASSASNLRIASATHVEVKGSSAKAGAALDIQAAGDVLVVPERNRRAEHRENSNRHFAASAGETQKKEDNKAGSMQYQAKAGYEVVGKTSETVDETLARASLEGATVQLDAGGTARLDSAQVNASAGDVKVSGQRIVLGSSSSLHQENTDTHTSGAGIGVTGGMDRSGSFSYGEHTRERQGRETTVAERTEITSTSDTLLTADHGKGQVDNRGAKIKASGEVKFKAGTVNNEAVHDTARQNSSRTVAEGTAGLNAETRDLTRPIQKVIEGRDQVAFQKGLEEALDAPSLGIDLVGNYGQRSATEQHSKAKVADIQGAQVSMEVAGKLADQGTRYKASEGQVSVKANSHEMTAAHDTYSSEVSRLDVNGSVRVDTVTSADINGRLQGIGSSLAEQKHRAKAVPSLIESAGGIPIQLGTDGRYEGTQFKGEVNAKVGGDLQIVQANDRETQSTTTTDGFAWAKAGTAPNKARSLGGGGSASHAVESSQGSQAVVAAIDGKAATFEVAGDFKAEGLRAGTLATPLESLSVKAGGTLEMAAAMNERSKAGERLGGGLQVSLSAAEASKGGGLGGHIDIARSAERSRQEQGAKLMVDTLALVAGGTGERALHVQGGQVRSKHMDLQAPYGGVLVEAARTTETKDNLAITAGAGANTLRTGNKDTDASGLHARLKVKVDNLDSLTHENTGITTTTLNLASADSARFEGVRVNAEQISGHVGGDLTVATRQDRVVGTEVNLDGRISREHNPQGLLNAVTAVAGPLGGKVKEKAGKDIQALDPNTSPSLALDVVRTHRTNAAKPTEIRGRDGIDLTVEGSTRLHGAVLKAILGQVNLGEGPVHTEGLKGRDYRADVSLNGSVSPQDLISNVLGELVGSKSAEAKADEHFNTGLIRTGGHDREQVLEAKIEHKRG
nr:hemagglutinin repeat-containing protein [Pseudomonas typographi]